MKLIPSALLLGALASTAHAQPAHFSAASRADDPLRRPLEILSEPRSFGLADPDGDGDDDLFFPHGLNRIDRAERTGDGFEWPQVYVEFDTVDDYYHGPTFLDVDGDGRLDLVHLFSFFGPASNYLRQTSTGLFERRVGVENPFAGMFAGIYLTGSAAGDLNGDGLTDLVVGLEEAPPSTTRFGHLALVEQTGPGAFALRTGPENPFSAITYPSGFGPSPYVVDADDDGDADLVVTCVRAPVPCEGRAHRYYEQTAPGVFSERTGTANPFEGVAALANSDLAVLDADADGDLDVLQAGTENGRAIFIDYQRTASGLVRQTSPYSLTGGFVFGDGGSSSQVAHFSFGDPDGDGDHDLVAGQNGTLQYYRRTGSPDEPFERREAQLNPFHWVQGPGLLHPALGDVDDDGDTDLVVGGGGSNGAGLRYVENVDVDLFVERTGPDNPFAGVTGVTYPALGDVDGDGDLDLVAGDRAGAPDRFRYLEQTGPGVFTERSGAANPLGGLSARQCVDPPYQRPLGARPVLGDLDGDGDLDLVNGHCFFQHIGDAFVPVWTAAANPLTELPSYANVPGQRWSNYVDALTDIDGDGDLDAFVMDEEDNRVKVQTFFNTGLAVAADPAADGATRMGRLGPPHPNPATGPVRLTLTVDRAQDVRVVVYDVLGRHVAVVHDGPVPEEPLTLTVETAGLPAGVYLVRADGESFVGTQRVTVVQ